MGTNDEKHVVFTGGKEADGKLYILDINDDDTFALRKSQIKGPGSGLCHLMKTAGIRNEYLTVGYIRSLFQTHSFADAAIVPADVVAVIADFYAIEMVHWIDREIGIQCRIDDQEKYRHWMIPLKDILPAKESINFNL